MPENSITSMMEEKRIFNPPKDLQQKSLYQKHGRVQEDLQEVC